MKTQLPLIALLAALACGVSGALQAAPQNSTPVMVRVSDVQRNGIRIAQAGTTEDAVWHRLGSPDLKLGNNMWVYHNYNSTHDTAIKHACTALMITFEDGRVSTMVLANEPAETVVARNIKNDPAFLARTLFAKN